MIREQGVYDMEKWDGQIFMSGPLTEWLPRKVEFQNVQEEVSEVYSHNFTVAGNMWDVELRVGFKLHKGFETREAAEDFFDAFVAKYPNSKIYLKENCVTLLKKHY